MRARGPCGKPCGVREIPVDEVADTVRRWCIEANHELRGDQVDALRRARSREESPIGQEVLDRLLANAEAMLAEMEGDDAPS